MLGQHLCQVRWQSCLSPVVSCQALSVAVYPNPAGPSEQCGACCAAQMT